jgi:hypothetical protein
MGRIQASQTNRRVVPAVWGQAGDGGPRGSATVSDLDLSSEGKRTQLCLRVDGGAPR